VKNYFLKHKLNKEKKETHQVFVLTVRLSRANEFLIILDYDPEKEHEKAVRKTQIAE